MPSESRLDLLESYVRCETVLLEPKKNRAAVISALQEEVQLERDARLIDPFVCIDSNGISYAMYIGERSGAPLGVCIRRHFSNFSDFLWIERTERSSARKELWSAVLVQDGLAIEEALNVPKADLRQILSEIYAPISVISSHKSLLEAWLPRSLGRGGKPQWVETSVSPLGNAAKLAHLSHLEEALRQANLKLKPVMLRSLQSALAAVLLASGAVGIYYYSAGEVPPWLRVIGGASQDANSRLSQSPTQMRELEEQLAKTWEVTHADAKPATAAYLNKAYQMLLEGWSIGLHIDRLTIAEDGDIELFFSDIALDDHGPLITAWCRLRNLEPQLDDVDGKASGSIIGQSPSRYADLGNLRRRISEEELLATAHHLGAIPLHNEKASRGSRGRQHIPVSATVEALTEKPTMARDIYHLTLSVPSFGNPEALLYLAEEQSLRSTFIRELDLSVDSKTFKIGPTIQLSVGSWAAL